MAKKTTSMPLKDLYSVGIRNPISETNFTLSGNPSLYFVLDVDLTDIFRICLEIPIMGGRLLETGVETFLKLKTDGKLGDGMCNFIDKCYLTCSVLTIPSSGYSGVYQVRLIL